MHLVLVFDLDLQKVFEVLADIASIGCLFVALRGVTRGRAGEAARETREEVNPASDGTEG